MEPQDRKKDRQEAQEEERGGGRETRTMTTWPKRLMTSLGETNNVVLWVVHVAQHRDVRPPYTSPPTQSSPTICRVENRPTTFIECTVKFMLK